MAEGQPSQRRFQAHPLRQSPQAPLLPGHFQQLLGVLVGEAVAQVNPATFNKVAMLRLRSPLAVKWASQLRQRSLSVARLILP